MAKQKKRIEFQKQQGLAMILLGLLLIITVGVFLYYSVLRIQGIPEFLPPTNTAFFFSFDKTGLENKNHPILKDFLDPFAKLNLLSAAEKGGYALIKSNLKNQNLLPAFLAEVKKQIPLQKGYLLFGDYLITSSSEEALNQIKEAVESKGSLANNIPFVQISQSLPKIADVSFTLQPQLLNLNPLLESFQIIKGNLSIQSSLASTPLWHIGGLFKTKRTYANFDRYQGKLLGRFPAFPLFFLAGENLYARLNLFGPDVFSSLQEFLKFYGAAGLSAEDNIFPLFKGEYGLSVYEVDNKQQFLFILDLKNAQNKENIEKIKHGMPNILSILMPQIREVILPDKTTGKEVFADPQNIAVEKKMIFGIETDVFTVKHRNFSIFFAEKDNLLFVGTDEKSLSPDDKQNLLRSHVYANSIKEVLRGSNEILYIDKEFFKKLMNDNVPKWLETGLAFKSAKGFSASIRYSEDILEMFVSVMIR